MVRVLLVPLLFEVIKLAGCSEFPSLATAKAYAISQVNITALVWQCPDLDPRNRSPGTGNNTIEVDFTAERLIEIEDVYQSIAVTATFYVRWSVFTCPPTGPPPASDIRERVLIDDPKDVWHPAVYFRNSVDDIAMSNNFLSDRIEAIVTRTVNPDQQALYFHWKQRGVYQAVCPLDLAKFPFDTQECSFNFHLVEPIKLQRFANPVIHTAFNSSAVKGWTFDKGWATQSTKTTDLQDEVSQVSFFVRFKRRPEYFTMNLLGPCIVLCALQMAAFLIPPNETDRICFSVYLLLALAVSQTQVLDAIPKTPQWIMLNYFIQLLGLICSLCTAYTIVMFCFVSRAPKVAARQVGKITLASLLEIFCFIFFVALFTAVSIFCLSNADFF